MKVIKEKEFLKIKKLGAKRTGDKIEQIKLPEPKDQMAQTNSILYEIKTTIENNNNKTSDIVLQNILTIINRNIESQISELRTVNQSIKAIKFPENEKPITSLKVKNIDRGYDGKMTGFDIIVRR